MMKNRVRGAALAALVLSASVALAAPAPAAISVSIDLGEVLDVLTYRVHTVFPRPDAPPIERTVNAVAGVPRLVNVDGGVLPDLQVEILPLPPNLITVTFTRTPSALGPLPALAEVLVDVPGGIGAAYGFDSRAGRTPPAVNGTFTFGLGGGGTNIKASTNTAFPGATPTLGVVAAVFTKGSDGSRVDPTTATAQLTPVPGSLEIAVSKTDARLDVTVDTSSPTIVGLDAATSAGPKERRLTGTVAQLPDRVAVSVIKGGANHHHVDYDATDVIDRVTLDVFEKDAGVITRHIAGSLEGVPTVMDADVTTSTVVVDGETKDTARVEVTATDAIRVAEFGLNKTDASPFDSTITEPIYAVASLDSEGGGGLVSAAVRAQGVRSITADTGDPLLIHVTSAGGPLRAVVIDTRPDSAVATMTATLTDVPTVVGVEFSPSLGTLRYDASSPIGVANFDLTDPAGLGSTSAGGPFRSPAGVVPTTLKARVEGIPGAVALTFKPARPSTAGTPLVTLNAGNATVGLVKATVTSGPAPATAIPDGADGLVIEDFADRFVAVAQVSGLRRLLVRTGGQFEERPGPADARPVAHLEVDTATDKGLFARLDRAGKEGPEFLQAEVSDIPPNLVVDLYNIDRMPCSEVEDDINSDTSLFAEGCLIFDQEDIPRVRLNNLDPDGNGFFDTVVRENPESRPVSPRIGTELVYSAGENVDDVTIRTNAGGLPNEAYVHLHDVPTSVKLCISKKETCTRGNVIREREGLTFSFDANGRMEVDAFLCEEPATGACVFDPSIEALVGGSKRAQWAQALDSMQAGVFVLDLTVEHVGLEMHSRKDETSAIALDTDLSPVTGLLALKQGEKLLVRAVLQPAFAGGGIVNGAVDVDAVLDLLPELLAVPFHADLLDFPNAALAANDMMITIHGVNPSFFPGLACTDQTDIDLALGRFEFADLAQELCLPRG